ncbi:MAG: M6 family metalloprotease domain-containing protein, partial [candidate division Zixibacteria bacterium]|nr:M6 family metalloprotease domain-containing protein [candidate division Zixibacteria bacterium]
MTAPVLRRTSIAQSMVAVCCLLIILLISASITASPPSPELYERLKQAGQLEQLAERMAAARANGVWPNTGGYLKLYDKAAERLQFDPASPDTLRVLVIMTDFSDNPASGGGVFAQPADFQTRLFSINEYDQFYTMSEFFRDNSAGGFILQGDVVGWYRMPETYAYYVNGNNGWGPCPGCAAVLADEAVVAADPDVDYGNYDVDGNGELDGLFIVFPGEGADWSGSDNHIWPHMGGTWDWHQLDGVNISIYSIEPEEQGGEIHSFGVFAHEYGHYLGLPDLYDTDYSSSGAGNWTLMAFGSWGDGGDHPAFLDAWCKSQLGMVTPINVTANLTNVDIPVAQYNQVAYRIWTEGQQGSEYFLVENRQAIDKEFDLPGSGLLILHIDETQWGNENEPRFKVSVEQADGRFDLEANFNRGDGGDVWSTSTQSEFDDLTTPNTHAWETGSTKTAVWDISDSDSLMHANLDITYSRPRYQFMTYRFSDSLYGNDNGVVEEGESITFTCTVKNIWLTAINVTATMSCDNNDIIFDDPTADFGTVNGEGGFGDNNDNPIVFSVPTGFASCLDSFYLSFDSDNPNPVPTLGLLVNIGPAQVLLVDDDNSADWEQALIAPLFARRLTFDLHDKAQLGSPSGALLNNYPIVMWLTGDERTNILGAADVAAMQTYMDAGGSLFLNGQSIIRQLDSDNQAFLHNYLRATYDSSVIYPIMFGVDGSPVGGGLKIRYGPTANQTDPQSMEPINGSVSNFTIPAGSTCLTYDGNYKLVLFSFGFEAISDQWQATGWAPPDTVFQRIIDFFVPETHSQNPTVADVVVVGEVAENVVNHTPTFSWSVIDSTANPTMMYEVHVGTGRNCHNSDNLWALDLQSGDDSSVVYSGDLLEDGQTYVVTVRTNNGVTWSAWSEFEFRMNSRGNPGIPYAPRAGELISTTTPTLQTFNAADPDGDTLTYDFELYDDPGLSNLITSTSAVPQVFPWTTWTVDVTLVEDQIYFWRTRSHDGFEYTDFSDPAAFRINAVNQAPGSFSLIGPPDGDTLPTQLALLTWQPATDNDPGDVVSYTVQLADNPGFTGSISMTGLYDTEVSYLADPNVFVYFY